MPHIYHMSLKVDRMIPRVVNKIDRTKDYYQLLIAEKVRAYKAFITFMDIFEWLRIPMRVESLCLILPSADGYDSTGYTSLHHR